MQKISIGGWSGKRSAHRFMEVFGLAAMVVVTLLFTGCGKSKPSSAAPTSAAPAAADASPAPAAMPQQPQYASPPVVVAANPEGGADLKQLNRAYIGWIVQNRQRPKSFDEFVALSGIQVPPPPAGKKYVIDKNGFINFENN